MRRLLLGVLIVVGVAVALVLGALLALPAINVAGLASRLATSSLGRDLRITSVKVSPAGGFSRWVTIRVQGATLANIDGATRPEMATLTSLTAEIDAMTLLHGPILARRLVVDGLDLVLERAGDTPNWRFGAPKPGQSPPKGPDYKWLPTMLDATLSGKITFRTRSGKPLVTTLDGVKIAAPDAVQQVRLTGPGSYQGVPVALDVAFASFDAVRRAPEPVPSEIRLRSGQTVIAFKGTMRAPLDIDGAQGELTIEAPTPDVIERVAGMTPSPFPPVRLLGTLDRDNSHWALANTTGALGASPIQGGDLTLDEGHPDQVTAALEFEALNLDELLGGGSGGGKTDIPIIMKADPDTLIDAKLVAGTLTYGGVKLTDASIDASLKPGAAAVEALAFGYLGGQVRASGRVETAAGAAASHVGAAVEADAIDIGQLSRTLALGAVPLSGRVTGRLHLEADGATLNQAAKQARISAVVTMQGGGIARELIELASTDARTLFRTAKGLAGVSCALGILDVRAGVGTVSPLRIRTSEGTIVGRGRFDLPRRSLDLTIASEARTTGFFALDVPVRVSGSFDSPSVSPAKLSETGRAQIAAVDNVSRLLPALRDYARKSPCLERGR